MRRNLVRLDFLPRRAPWGEYALLAAALLVASSIALAGLQARTEMHSAAARLQQATARDQRIMSGTALLAARAALPAEVSRSLATPWSELLSDLEKQAEGVGDDVALLRVEPDREHASVRLVAEARSLPAALKYVRQLQRLPSLRRAILQSHEILVDQPQRPVRVEISASWSQGS